MEAVELSSELQRIGTFLGWPGENASSKTLKPSAFELAKAGFYYTGRSDTVCCFSCNLHVEDWERRNKPFVVHATRSPECPFILGSEALNRPVFVPPEKDYDKILTMLRETGRRVAATPAGTSYNASNLIVDTLFQLYGESLLSKAPQIQRRRDEAASKLTSTQRSSPTLSTVVPGNRPHSRGYRAARHSESGYDPRQSPRSTGAVAVNEPPPRRSSASDSADPQRSNSPAHRPSFQRARSYAADPRTHRNAETVAQRQTSCTNPGTDQTKFQESEEARLRTFDGWIGIRGATAQEFAQAGFVYIGAPDHMQCVFCNGVLKNWNDNDQPIEEHRKHFPNCSFVNEFLSIIAVGRPRHPRYKTEPSRLDSFQGWPMTRNPTPAELARAGFFYVGHGDSVKCFFCDGGLRNWEPNDDPWKEHARWFPKCEYVKQSKGIRFIDKVLNDTNLKEYQTASVEETEPKSTAQTSIADSRNVDRREVSARMDGPIVKAVLKMDIPRKLVKKAIKKRLAENGEDFTSAEALLEAVFSLDLDESETSGGDADEQLGQDGDPFDPPPPSTASSTGSSDPESLRVMEEYRQLKEQRICKICMDEDACVAFLPCGHLVCCSTCAPALNSCPICRGKIRGTVRTYMS